MSAGRSTADRAAYLRLRSLAVVLIALTIGAFAVLMVTARPASAVPSTPVATTTDADDPGDSESDESSGLPGPDDSSLPPPPPSPPPTPTTTTTTTTETETTTEEPPPPPQTSTVTPTTQLATTTTSPSGSPTTAPPLESIAKNADAQSGPQKSGSDYPWAYAAALLAIAGFAVGLIVFVSRQRNQS